MMTKLLLCMNWIAVLGSNYVDNVHEMGTWITNGLFKVGCFTDDYTGTREENMCRSLPSLNCEILLDVPFWNFRVLQGNIFAAGKAACPIYISWFRHAGLHLKSLLVLSDQGWRNYSVIPSEAAARRLGSTAIMGAKHQFNIIGFRTNSNRFVR